MSKKIKFIVKDRTILELAEDAQKGDIIDISQANQIDASNFKQLIEQSATEQAKVLSATDSAKLKADYEVKLAKLHAEIEAIKTQEKLTFENKINSALAELKLEKERLANELASTKSQNKTALELAVTKAETEKQKEISELKVENLKIQEKLKETEDQWMRRHFSTKSYGEELEKIVYEDFLSVQQAGAFPNAEFIKDNQVISSGEELKGTKGDFIFKDYDDNHNPILTIEIEVKTEQTTNSKVKTHNRDHYAKLDLDRKKKECEYAILVSELEKDNRVFDGIYKVPNYEKMYVVRPQSLISLISTLKDSLNKNKDLLSQIQQKNIEFADRETFEKNLADVKIAVNKSVEFAHKNFEATIAEIDKSIASLQKAKEDLLKCGGQLGAANRKVVEITTRKLLKGCEGDPFKK